MHHTPFDNYSINVSLLLIITLSINVCPEEEYILPLTASPKITYTFLLIFECPIQQRVRKEHAKSPEYEGKLHLMGTCCRIFFFFF